MASAGSWPTYGATRGSCSFEGEGHNRTGLRDYLVVHGRATVVEGGAPPLLQELARTFLGAGVRFPPMDDPPGGFVMHIAVDRVSGSGPWA